MTATLGRRSRRSHRAARLTAVTVVATLATTMAGCSSSPPAAGPGGTSTARQSGADAKTITVTYPVVAPIRLPDLSVLDSGGDAMAGGLASLQGPGSTGLDVVSPTCDAKGNITTTAPDLFKLSEVENYLNLDGDSNIRLTTDSDGTKRYTDLGGDRNLRTVVRKDGSGEISDVGGDRNFRVVTNKDGSGQLSDLGADRNLRITVNSDGSGELSDLGGDRNLRITVKPDGSGEMSDLGGESNLRITINADGSGNLTDLGGPRNLEMTVAADGSGFVKDLGGASNADLTVGSDGAVKLRDHGGALILDLTMAPDGSGHYKDLGADIEFDFGSDKQATDGSGYRLQLPQTPVFSAPDRFPPLGKLGRLRPPCATVLRFAADALFDFDKATLKPEAKALITRAASALTQAGTPIQVEGHTDAKGSDAYNDDLSIRRAEAFSAALKEQGVTVTITTKGWGEKRPVAPNTTASGGDNPSGRAQNRRVEVVLKN